MPNKIILKKSSVSSKVPLSTDLDFGELAINYADGKIYFKKSNGTIDAFSSGTGASKIVYTLTNPTNEAWYTIASNNNITESDVSGVFYVYDQNYLASHVKFTADTDAGYGYLSVSSNSGYGSISKIRLVNTGATFLVQIQINGTTGSPNFFFENTTGVNTWTPVNWTLDNTSYTASQIKAEIDILGKTSSLIHAGEIYSGNLKTQYRVLNTGNYSGYALPLTGGTLTGVLRGPGAAFTGFGTGVTGGNLELGFDGSQVVLQGYNRTTSAYLPMWLESSNLRIGINGSSRVTVDANALNSQVSIQQSGNQVLHAGNYTSYSPSVTGTGASGTWGINVTGASNGLASTGYGEGRLTWLQQDAGFQTWNGGWASHLISNHGNGSSYYNQTLILPFWGPPQYMRKEGGTDVGPWVFLTTENYSNYSLPLSGGTISGNLGLGTNPDLRLSVSGDAHISGYLYMGGSAGIYSTWGSREYTTSGLRYFNASSYEFNNSGYGSTFTFTIDSTRLAYKSNTVLHAGNYSSYALPLSGGTVTGVLNATGGSKIVVQNSQDGGTGRGLYLWNSGDTNWVIYMGQAGAGKSASGGTAATGIDGRGEHHIRSRVAAGTGQGFIWENNGEIALMQLTSDAGNLYTRGQIYAGNSTSNLVLHTGNYSSYALPLSGGTLTGAINMVGTQKITNAGFAGVEYWNSSSIWEGYIGTENNSGNLRYNSRQGTHTWYANGTFIGSLSAAGLNTSGSETRAINFVFPSSYNGTGYGNLIERINFPWYSEYWDIGVRRGGATDIQSMEWWLNGSSKRMELTRDGVLYVNGNTALHAGNYTGFDGNLRALGANDGVDFNATAYNSMYYAHIASSSNKPTSYSYPYGTILTFDPGLGVGGRAQFYVSHAGNDLIFRGGWGAAGWNSWNKVLTDQNYTNYSPSLTGAGASGTWGINITGSSASAGWSTYNQILDTRAGQLTPNDYQGYRVTYEFTDQIVSGWHSAITMQGWHSGYAAWQLIGGATTSTHENWYLRSGINTTWNSLRTILHSGNYSSYALPLSGGTISGTITVNTGDGVRIFKDGGSSITSQLYFANANNSRAYNWQLDENSNAALWGYGGASWAKLLTITSSGSFTAAGNVTAYSDERLKTDWQELPVDFIERLAKIKHGTYSRIDTGERQAGASAQDWKELLPEVVKADSDEKAILSLAYGNAAVVAAIELAKRVLEQETRIKRLESLVEKLIGE